MPQSKSPESRVFTYREAVALLPRIQQLTETARQDVESLTAAATNPEQAQAAADHVVRSWAEAIVDLGLEVKGLWLVDFDNGSGYYCWRYPESGLHYFHSYEDGFGGRMRIQ